MDPIDQLRSLLAQRRKEGGGRVILAGTAGTGKTTAVKRVLDEGIFPKVTLLAPTGKAARRISQVTGRRASTIHSMIYGGPVEDESSKELRWADPMPIGGEGELIVVDEASMVGSELASDLQVATLPGTTTLVVGDPAQLPPVDDAPGFDLTQPDVRLTYVYRSDEGIMRLAYAILATRNAKELLNVIYHKPGTFKNVFHPGDLGNPGRINPWNWRGQTITNGSDSVLITYRNIPRHDLNKAVRQTLGFGQDELRVGEVLCVMSNNRDMGYTNGEGLVVSGFPDQDDPDAPPHLNPLLVRSTVFPNAPPRLIYTTVQGFGQSPRDWREERREDSKVWRRMMDTPRAFRNPKWRQQAEAVMAGAARVRNPGPAGEAVHVNFGYCLTCHKMQGSEADNIGIVWADHDSEGRYWSDGWLLNKSLDDTRAWWYTAVTRARKAVIIWR